MKIVTDSGADLIFSPEIQKTLQLDTVPLVVTLDDNSYREGLDIQNDAFYDLLVNSGNMPTTSTPDVSCVWKFPPSTRETHIYN